jgi:ABC-type branched-subunit amino acid transport system ATPase component
MRTNIAIIGPKASGKTTLANYLKLGIQAKNGVSVLVVDDIPEKENSFYRSPVSTGTMIYIFCDEDHAARFSNIRGLDFNLVLRTRIDEVLKRRVVVDECATAQTHTVDWAAMQKKLEEEVKKHSDQWRAQLARILAGGHKLPTLRRQLKGLL